MSSLYAALAGLWIWTAQFSAIYGLTAIACARGYGDARLFGIGAVPLAIVAATLLALVLDGLALAGALSRSRSLAAAGAEPGELFLARLATVIAALSLPAIAWNGLPALIVTAC